MLDPAAVSELSSHVVEVMKKIQEAMYTICLLHDVDFRGLVNQHEVTLGEDLLGSLYFY